MLASTDTAGVSIRVMDTETAGDGSGAFSRSCEREELARKVAKTSSRSSQRESAGHDAEPLKGIQRLASPRKYYNCGCCVLADKTVSME